jgi:hypothetical protein
MPGLGGFSFEDMMADEKRILGPCDATILGRLTKPQKSQFYAKRIELQNKMMLEKNDLVAQQVNSIPLKSAPLRNPGFGGPSCSREVKDEKLNIEDMQEDEFVRVPRQYPIKTEEEPSEPVYRPASDDMWRPNAPSMASGDNSSVTGSSASGNRPRRMGFGRGVPVPKVEQYNEDFPTL